MILDFGNESLKICWYNVNWGLIQLRRLHKKSPLKQITDDDITTNEILCGLGSNLPGTTETILQMLILVSVTAILEATMRSQQRDVNLLADTIFSLHQCLIQNKYAQQSGCGGEGLGISLFK